MVFENNTVFKTAGQKLAIQYHIQYQTVDLTVGALFFLSLLSLNRIPKPYFNIPISNLIVCPRKVLLLTRTVSHELLLLTRRRNCISL